MKKLLYLSIPGFILLLAFGFNGNNSIYGHTFSGDESASFLASVEMIKAESKLAQDQLSSNATIAKDHAEHAAESITSNDTKEIKERNPRLATELNSSLTDLINAVESKSPSGSDVNSKVSNLGDILSEVVGARIDKNQLNNVTVKALVVNDLVGEGLEHYQSALGMKENKTSASNATESGNNETKIVDEADYQSSQAAISRAIDMYNQIKPNQNKNSSELGDALSSMKSKIDSKSPFDEADKIVDDKITPLLNDIFKVKLGGEEADHANGQDHGGNKSTASSQNETH